MHRQTSNNSHSKQRGKIMEKNAPAALPIIKNKKHKKKLTNFRTQSLRYIVKLLSLSSTRFFGVFTKHFACFVKFKERKQMRRFGFTFRK